MTGRILALVALILAMAGGPLPADPAPAAGPPVVVASVHPIADLLSRIGGDDFEVRALFDPGVHPRQPKAAMASLPSEVLLYVRIGGAFEGSADIEAAAKARQVLDLSAGLELTAEEEAERIERRILAAALGTDVPSSEKVNPWFWLDPRKAGEAADLMAVALAGLRPEAAGRIAKRTKQLKEKLLRLDGEIAVMLAKAEGGPFAVFTTSWAYFARRYGLREIHLAAVVPGGGPGRHSLKGAAAALRRTGAGRVYTDLTFPASPAEAVATRAGAELVVLHPLGRATAGGGGYFSILREAAGAVAGGSP